MAQTKQQAEESAKETSSTTTEEKAQRTTVHYIGTADERKILKSDFASIGIEDQDAVSFSKKNRFQIPVSELSEGAVRYFDEDDDGFVVK